MEIMERSKLINYLNRKKFDLFSGKKVAYLQGNLVCWSNLTTREIYAHSIDADRSGSVSGYKVAEITANWEII